MAKAGYGGAVQRIKGRVDMVANSKPSAKSGKQSTKRTPQQELEILQQSIANCMSAGIDMRLNVIYDGGNKTLALVFGDGIDYQSGDLIWRE